MGINKFNAVSKKTAKKDEIDIFLETLLKRKQNFNESYYVLNPNRIRRDSHKELSHAFKDLRCAIDWCIVEEGGKDLYITPNAFVTPHMYSKKEQCKSSKTNVRVLKNIFLDLDLKDTKYSIADAHIEILQLVQQGLIPYPSMIVCSGRGLHVYWNIGSYKANQGLIKYWKKITKSMAERLKHLGVDSSKLEDYSAYLRIPGTINGKNGSKCYLIEANQNIYTMNQIKETYFKNDYRFQPKPKEEKEKKPQFQLIHGEARELNKPVKKPSLRVVQSYNLLHARRLRDLEKLLAIRDYDTYNRGHHLFILAYYYSIVNKEYDLNKLIEYISNINDKLSSSKKYRKIEKLCKSALKYSENERLRYKTETLIKKLEITGEEQEKLRVIVSMDEQKARRNRKVREKRRNADGLTKKQEELQDLAQKVLELKNAGLSYRKIAKELNITLSKVQRCLSKDIIIQQEEDASSIGLGGTKGLIAPTKEQQEQDLAEEILELKVAGLSYRGIAKELNISLGKVQRRLKPK